MALSKKFIIAQKFTAAAEGGLTDDPQDRGGITNYGVCLAFLTDIAKGSQANDKLADLGVLLPVSRQSIIKLTKQQAEEIFKWQFWDKLGCDELPVCIGCLVYDAAVNHGRVWGVKLAQRGYNAMGKGEKLVVDGVMGPKTRAALSALDSPELHYKILEARMAYYDAIIRNHPSQKVFKKGWYNRVKNLGDYIWSL